MDRWRSLSHNSEQSKTHPVIKRELNDKEIQIRCGISENYFIIVHRCPYLSVIQSGTEGLNPILVCKTFSTGSKQEPTFVFCAHSHEIPFQIKERVQRVSTGTT